MVMQQVRTISIDSHREGEKRPRRSRVRDCHASLAMTNNLIFVLELL